MLKQEAERANKVVTTVQFQPPYPMKLHCKPYPKDYVNPKFRQFDGRKGNVRDHVIGFIDDLWIYASDEDLRLREFSKSLIRKVYNCFFSLPGNSIRSWE